LGKKIRLAIVGAGNCASSLVQGIGHYSSSNDRRGMITPVIGGYGPEDVEVVAAFDVVDGKVGAPLAQALQSWPNETLEFGRMADSAYTTIVSRGPTLDGLGRYLREVVEESGEPVADVAQVLRDSGATVLVSYLPVGSDRAAEYYADACLQAGVAMVNCMPAFIASRPEWADRFRAAGVPIVGDDIKSQVGATIVHRVLAQLLHDRGVELKRTYQLNVGGNTDFLNMLERERLKSKKISKTRAVTSVMGVELPETDVHVGPSDHVPWLTDRKFAFIRLEAEAFGGAPLNIELKLEVWDSPNSAGVVLDALRIAQLARDAGVSGPVETACAWYMKSPPVQMTDDAALLALRQDVDAMAAAAGHLGF